MISLVLISGCATSMSSERDALQSAVLARSPSLDGLTLPRFDAPDEVPAEVEQLLSRPLTADDAVRVAMLANREGRAALAEVGIAKGAWVQAGLIPNPEAELSVRAPGGAQPVQLDLGLELNLTGTLLAPMRAGVAESTLSAERLRAAGVLLDLGYRTRLAFLNVQATSARLELRLQALEAQQASWESMAELDRVGNVTGLQVASELAAVEDEGDVLSEDEITCTAMVLLEAGHEATVNSLANGMRAMMLHRDQWQRLTSGEVAPRTAIEDMIRWDAPLQLFERWALERDIEIAGQVIPLGAEVAMLFGAANRDPRRFADAARVDVGRGDTAHVGFGGGIHFCIGAPLARLELEVSVAQLVHRFPDVQLAAEPVYHPTFVLRGLTALRLSTT
jgi:hypothetical protein